MAEEVVVPKPVLGIAPARLRRASWGAIFGGAFVTLVLQLMLTLLGIGVGIAQVQTEAPPPSQAWLSGSGIWLLVTGLISLWIGACVAGRLCGGPRRADGLLHGLVTWSVAMVATLALLATAFGAALGGTTGFVAAGIGGGPAVQAGQPEAAPAAIVPNNRAQPAGKALTPTGRTESQTNTPSPATSFGAIQWTALWGFFALFLGLLAAAWGGWAGTASLPVRADGTVDPAAAI